jgi:hypothetical protein
MAPKEADAATAAASTMERQSSVGNALMSAGDQPKVANVRSLAPQGTRGQVLAQAECYVSLDGRKISLESELVSMIL